MNIWSILTLLAIPVFAYAGVFSFFTGFFDNKGLDTNTSRSNSQTMALLESSYSPIASASTSTKEVLIEGGTSLASGSDPVLSANSGHNVNSDQISIYVVHKGDTLPEIAKMFGVSVNTIRWGNDLKSDKLKEGDRLVILPVSGVQHTVKKGETVQSIAKLHKGDVDEVMQYNNLTKDSKLAVGDVIFVPDGEAVVGSSGSSSSGSSGSSNNSSGVGTKSPSVPVYDGYYMRPLIGGIKTQGIHGHNGVDLASSYGSNILAAADGEVIISKNSGYNGGYGSYVVIKHANGTQTLYAHLSATKVSEGDNVKQGQVIGLMGQTGKATGVHLHFEIRGARNPF